MFKSKKRKLAEECWNLDYAWIVWLNKRLPIYLDGAKDYVDLEFHKFDYKGKTYTQREVIERMIKLASSLVENERYFDLAEDSWNDTKELLDLWALAAPSLWW